MFDDLPSSHIDNVVWLSDVESLDRVHLLIEGWPDHYLVPEIVETLFDHGGQIHDLQCRSLDGIRAIRVEFSMAEFSSHAYRMHSDLRNLVAPHLLSFRLRNASAHRMNVSVMVSQESQCLTALIDRSIEGQLPVKIAKIISTCPRIAQSLVGSKIACHPMRISGNQNFGSEETQIRLLSGSTELVVLARYDHSLSHGFLKAIGVPVIAVGSAVVPSATAVDSHASVSDQVRLIQATARYITGPNDEGPVIAGHIEPIAGDATDQHGLRCQAEALEARVLTAAVALHVEDRIVPTDSGKVIIFPRAA